MKKLKIITVALFYLIPFTGKAHIAAIPADSTKTGKTWAVIVGISNYKNIRSLNYADRDAQAFYNYLVNTKGGPMVNPLQVKLLLNENALSTEIYAALDWLKESVKENDRVVFYFSGHADVERKSEDQDGFLLAYNSPVAAYMTSGTVSIKYLREYLKAYVTVNKVKDVLLIVDACRSGKLAGGQQGVQLTRQALKESWDGRIIKILSAQENELSFEGARWGGGRGVFSYYLVKGLEGVADRNNDHIISNEELAEYLLFSVADATGNSQHPQMEGNAKQALFIFDRKRRLLPGQDTGAVAQMNRGLGTGIADKLSPEIKATYEKYLEYLRQGRLIWGKNEADTINCAKHVYLELIDKPGAENIQASLRSSFIAALQRKTQVFLDAYVKVKPQTHSLYEVKKEMMYLKQIAPAGYILYNYISARAYFVAYTDQKNGSDLIRKSLEYEQDSPYAWNDLGVNYYGSGCQDSAIYCFRKAIKAAPNWALPYNNAGNAYDDKKHFQTAISCYRKAIKLNPRSSAAYTNLAHVYLNLKDYKTAEFYCKKAIQVDPKYSVSYFGLATVYEAVKARNKEILSDKKGLQFSPDSITAATVYVNIGKINMDRKLYNAALLNFKKALQFNPQSAGAYFSTGEVYQELKNYDLTVLNYQKAIRLDSTSNDAIKAYGNIGTINLYKNDYSGAIKYLEKAIQLGSSIGLSYNNLGVAYQNLNNFSAAISSYQKAIKIDPKYAPGFINLGTVYLLSQTYDKAIFYLQKAEALKTKQPDAYINLGLAYVHNKNYKKGLFCLRKGLELKPAGFSNYYNLACGYSIAGNMVKSLQYLKQTIKMGFKDYNQFMGDDDLVNLRKTAGFAALMRETFPDKVK